MEERPSKFMDEYRRGLQKQRVNIQQAIAIIQASLQLFKDKQDSWYDYYTVKVELAGIMRDNGQLMRSSKIFIEIIDQLKHPEINEKMQEWELKRVNFSAFQNYAKVLIQLAADQMSKESQDFNRSYDVYRGHMNRSFNYFRQAQKILLNMLQVQATRQGMLKDEEVEWYLRLLSNFNQFFFMEVGQFMDVNCMNSILALTESAEKLFQLNKYQKKVVNEMETHLYRCYYYKSIVLELKNQPKEAIELLIKVYHYQKRQDRKHDAEKSRDNIFRLLLKINDLKQIHKYFDKSHKDQVENQVNKIKLWRQNFRKMFAVSLKQKTKLSLAQIENELDGFEDGVKNNFYDYDYQMVDELFEKSLFLYEKKQQKCFLYYFIAEANYKLRRYQKSIRNIRQSIKFFSVDSIFALNDLKNEELKIRCQIQPSNIELPLIFAKLRQQINNQLSASNNQNRVILMHQLKQLNKEQKIFIRTKKKFVDKNKYLYQNAEEQKLIVELQRMQKKYERQKLSIRQSKSSLDDKQKRSSVYQLKNNKSSEGGQSQKNISFAMLKQNQKLYNPLQNYIKQCKQKNVIEREIVKQLLRKQLKQKEFNLLQQLINLSIEQLQILLTIIKVSNLDLRNHRLNDNILQHVLNDCDINMIQQFKINGTNLISNELLMKIIAKMNQLGYLSFVDFSSCRPRSFNLLEMINKESEMDIQEEKPRSIVHVLYLLGNQRQLQNLKILKLKYCNLLDGHLRQMKLENYQNIEEISLSHNLIQGFCLDQVMKLRKISKVNFSDNPLQTISFQKWKYRFSEQDFRIKSLKLNKIKFVTVLRQQVKFAIARVQAIYLSECSQLRELVDEISENCLQGITLFFLTKIVMKNVNLDEINMHNLLNMSRYLKQIDLRGCVFGFETKKQIEYEKLVQINLQILISDQQQQLILHNTFSLVPVKR